MTISCATFVSAMNVKEYLCVGAPTTVSGYFREEQQAVVIYYLGDATTYVANDDGLEMSWICCSASTRLCLALISFTATVT